MSGPMTRAELQRAPLATAPHHPRPAWSESLGRLDVTRCECGRRAFDPIHDPDRIREFWRDR